MTLQIQVPRKTSTDEQLIQGFVEDCKLRGLSSESIRSYESNLRILSGFLEGVDCSL